MGGIEWVVFGAIVLYMLLGTRLSSKTNGEWFSGFIVMMAIFFGLPILGYIVLPYLVSVFSK